MSADDAVRDDYMDGVSVPLLYPLCTAFLFIVNTVLTVIYLVRSTLSRLFKMIGFSIFLFTLIFAWGLVLLYLKLRYGVERVGCAAGGGVVDVTLMHMQNMSRTRRKNRILRNWRVQTVFLMASMTLPVLSFLLANHGLDPFLLSLVEVHEVSNEIDSRAYIGIHTAQRTRELHSELTQLLSMDLLSFCPNYETSEWAEGIGLLQIQERVTFGLEEAEVFADDFAGEVIEALYEVTELTERTENTANWLDKHDWIIRLFLVALNIVNCFFLFSVFLTKNEVDYVALQAMASFVLLPMFVVITLGFAISACAVAIGAMANADFCAGGPGPGSPLGTFREGLVAFGYNQSSRVFHALDHYANVSFEELLACYCMSLSI